MTLTVQFLVELAAALEAEGPRGQALDQVAGELLVEQLAPVAAQRSLALAASGSAGSGRSAADGDQLLAEWFGRDS